MHRLPDVLRFEEHRQKHRRRCFFQKHRLYLGTFVKSAHVYVPKNDTSGTRTKILRSFL